MAQRREGGSDLGPQPTQDCEDKLIVSHGLSSPAGTRRLLDASYRREWGWQSDGGGDERDSVLVLTNMGGLCLRSPFTKGSTGCNDVHSWTEPCSRCSRPPTPTPTDTSLAVLFDGRPMIDAGIPGTVRSLQEEGAHRPAHDGLHRVDRGLHHARSHRGWHPDGSSAAWQVRRHAPTLPRAIWCESPQTRVDASCWATAWAATPPFTSPHAGRSLFGGAATGSAALWWPGDHVQLSGSQIAAEVQAATGLRLGMQAGTAEDPDLLRSNREFWERADAGGLDIAHVEHSGGDELSAWRDGIGQALRSSSEGVWLSTGETVRLRHVSALPRRRRPTAAGARDSTRSQPRVSPPRAVRPHAT